MEQIEDLLGYLMTLEGLIRDLDRRLTDLSEIELANNQLLASLIQASSKMTEGVRIPTNEEMMEELARADHMEGHELGRPVQPGVDKFWTPLPKEVVKPTPILDGHTLCMHTQQGPHVKFMLAAALKHQIDNKCSDINELLSVALNSNTEGK